MARRTQQQRREQTQKRILDAVIRCLRDEGSAGATTTRIAEVAGVSRGALMHHFPSKAALMQAALDRVLNDGLARFLQAIDGLPEGPDRLHAMIDALWAAISDPDAFLPWLELVVASRGDPDLRETITAFTRRTETVVRTNFQEIFGLTGEEQPLVTRTPLIVFLLMDGLALRRLVITEEAPDAAEAETLEVIKQLSSLFQMVVPPRR